MLIKNLSSFRDNKATVYDASDRILRKVDNSLNINFKKFLNSNFYKKILKIL